MMGIWTEGLFPKSILEPLEMLWIFGFHDRKEMGYLGLSTEREPELRIIVRNRCRMKAEFHQTLSHIRK